MLSGCHRLKMELTIAVGSRKKQSPALFHALVCLLGVLLLNAVLTVRAHQATSHRERGWEQFTDVVVSWLNKNLHGVVFMLWGAYAQKKGSSIDRVQLLFLSFLSFPQLGGH